MPSTYPGAIDNFSNPSSTNPLSNPAHASQHSNTNDAIEAVENTLGVNPQGVYLTVAARMSVVDSAAASAAASASAAAISASIASIASIDSASFANLAAASLDSFDDRYLGAKATAPTLDNDGNALLTGALYWNTASSQMFVYTGTTWQTLSSATVPQAISVSASAPALRVTQTGTGDALLVEDSANPDATPFVINTSGNVGIGIASPTALLDVRGVTSVGAGSAAAPSLTTTGDLNTGIYFPAADTIAFSEGGVECMRIDSNGLITGAGTSLGAWTAYTPTFNGVTLNNGTAVGYYSVIGKWLALRAQVTLGTTSAVTGDMRVTLPSGFSIRNAIAGANMFNGYALDDSTGSFYSLGGILFDLDEFTLRVIGTNGLLGIVNATSPITWATGDQVRFAALIEI